MTDVRHILVLPDRDAAEEIAEEIAAELADRFGKNSCDSAEGEPAGGELQLVREALAGEDDAEDAQWLVVLEGPAHRYDTERLDALAHEYDGWLERS